MTHSPDEKPRILMITGRADFGGGPEHVYQLCKALLDRADLWIACPREFPYWSRYVSLVGESRMLEIPHRRFSVNALRKLVRFARENRCGVIHAHGRGAGAYGRPAATALRLPCCYTPHGTTPIKGLKTGIYALIEYLLSFVTAYTIAVSPTEEKDLRKVSARKNRLRVIQNGVEIPLAPVDLAAKLGKPLEVVHATRYVYQKNPELLIRVLEELRTSGDLERFRFIILGEGEGREAFAKDIARAGLEHAVDVAGAVTNAAPYLDKAFCLISTSRWEGLPLFVLEAMARGVPAVATKVVGNVDAVAHGETGFLFDESSPSEAANYLKKLAGDEAEWRAFCLNSRVRAETIFSVRAMAQSTLQLYEAAIG